MKKGFTLIELLSVIVILAIIALITTPIVMNTIEKSKKGANLRGCENYIEAVNTKIAESLLTDTKITDGEYKVSDLNIEMNGTKPSDGILTIKDGNVIDYTLNINNNIFSKDSEMVTLPSEYTYVNYLKNINNSYITLPIKNEYKAEIDIQFEKNQKRQLMGQGTEASYYFGSNELNYYEVGGGMVIKLDTTIRRVVHLDRKISSNKVSMSMNVENNTITRTSVHNDEINFSLFNFANDSGYLSASKIYSVKFYSQDNQLIYNLIPCYRNSDSKFGMYDAVNKVFYEGTGEFIAG